MKSAIVFMFCILTFMPFAAHAQSGCSDSPENPTPILALAGSVGFAAAHLLTRKRK
jgi:XrtJ-associated TM-motif-TM protein